MDFTFDKTERLCSKKALDALFSEGKSKNQFPVKLIYRASVFESAFPARVVFIVPKKKHKRANRRNAIRRRMREIYRLNRHRLYPFLKTEKLDLMFVYLSTETAEYTQLETCMCALLDHLARQQETPH